MNSVILFEVMLFKIILMLNFFICIIISNVFDKIKIIFLFNMYIMIKI